MTENTLAATTNSAEAVSSSSQGEQRIGPIPSYMHEVYDWAYVNPKLVSLLDRNIVVRVLLFLNDRRLMRAYLDRIKPGMRVWQVAHVYGDLVRLAAEKCGPHGHFQLTDVTPIQVSHGTGKLQDLPWAQVVRSDAGSFRASEPQDLICSFFLLHEVPDNWKRAVVDNMLSQLPEGAEALFVDYHGPSRWQPVRYILKVVNRLLEPFAEALWDHEISHFSSEPERFTWEKRTIFGGVYQIVSVRHKKTA